MEEQVMTSIFLHLWLFLFFINTFTIQTANGTVQMITETPTNETRLFLNMTAILREPFLYDIVNLDNTTKRIGYIQDIIDELQLRMEFDYQYLIVPDGNYGVPDENGIWNGMVGELYYGRADMIAADLTVNSARSEVIEYTVPFMRIDLGVVYKKPTVQFTILAYLMPFANEVWYVVGGALLIVIATLWIFGKYGAPNEHIQGVPASFYFGVACLLGQGPDSYPKSMQARVVAVTWWFFSLTMLTFYTAGLTAMLTVNRVTLPINTIEDLLYYDAFHYAVEPGQATYWAFKSTSYEPFQKMWDDMASRDTGFFVADEGMARVRERNDFAFIRESPYIDFDVTFAPCDLEVVYSSTSPKSGAGYGFAFPKGSPLAEVFSSKILELVEDGTMANIHKKWFVIRSQCANAQKLSAGVDTIEFSDAQGIFLTFGIGLFASFLFFGIRVGRKKVKAEFCTEKQHSKQAKMEKAKDIDDGY